MSSYNGISSAGLRVVRLLVGREPRTVEELTKAAGVTRTAVTGQLYQLIDAGLVERQIEQQPNRGRPRHKYKATEASLLLFTASQRALMPSIFCAIENVGSEKLMRGVLKQVTHALAERYNKKIAATKPESRLRKLAAILNEEGGVIEVGEYKGRMVVYKRNCPLMGILEDKRAVCRIDLELMKTVVGEHVERTACRHDGAPCCAFAMNGARKAE
jgi:predicted ArsR family transcriptional regulator